MKKTAGYTLLDKKRKVDILNELKVTTILSRIKSYRKMWRAHVHRCMNEEHSPERKDTQLHTVWKKIKRETEKEAGGCIGDWTRFTGQ